MIQNYFKIIFRSLLKNKGFSILNIFGLAIGITCAAFIFLWVEDEVNFNSIYANKDYIYKVYTNQEYNGEIFTFDATPGLLAPTLKEEIPGIHYSSRFNEESKLVAFEDKSIYKYGAYVDDDFFKMFDIHFIEGNLKNVLSNINGIVIDQKTAKDFFGSDKNIVGKTLKFDNTTNHIITGVIANLPNNVTLKYNWLASFKAYEFGKEYLKYWGNNSTSTIVQLQSNANATIVNEAVKKIIPSKTDNDGRIYGILHSMNDWRLYSSFKEGVKQDGRIVYVRLFSIIAIIILLIASINYMNLTTAQSEKRAKEVGVRKVLGSKRKSLIFQFFSEAFIITCIAVALSVLFVYFLLPQFNSIINKELTIDLLKPSHNLAILIIILVCSLLSGFYPALYLSSFRPVNILKGLKSKKGSSKFIRNGLVITQFTASIILIISTVIIYQQIAYVKNRDLGFNKSNLIAIKIQGDLAQNMDAVKQEILNTGLIENVGVNSYNILNGGYNGSGYSWKGKEDGFDPLISFRWIDNNFLPTVGINIIEGRNFYKNPEADKNKVIITQTFAEMINNENITGSIIRNDNREYEVIGVVNDFQYGSMYRKSGPVMFFNVPENAQLIYTKIKENTPVTKAIDKLSAIIKSNNPAFPFEYNFVEDTFNNKFSNEMLVKKLSQLFAILAILISCFGLFGLTAYTAEQRSKEIGVRKVLGASISNIINLLSKDFLKLVFFAIVIAVPLAWYYMSNWLENYAYRIDISWWMFAVAIISAIGIAIVTVSLQSVKIAIQNPIKSIKTE